jgi:hypothetical protein
LIVFLLLSWFNNWQVQMDSLTFLSSIIFFFFSRSFVSILHWYIWIFDPKPNLLYDCVIV